MAKIQCNVISYVLKRTVDLTVVLPTISIPETFQDKGELHHEYPFKYPVLYLLHGFGNNHAQWTGYSNVELFAEERKIAVVMFSGENKAYLSNESDDFEKFIAEELPEFITNTFPISKQKEDTYIAGLSMGGFGALYNGLKRADLYQAIGAFSPALRMQGVAIDLFDIVENLDAAQPIYLACGENDFLYEDNVKFAQKLKEKNFEHTWTLAPNYQHEWRFWNEYIEKFLDWLPRTDGYKDVRRPV